jgi:hypothetical protein
MHKNKKRLTTTQDEGVINRLREEKERTGLKMATIIEIALKKHFKEIDNNQSPAV